MFGFGKKQSPLKEVSEKHLNRIVDYTCISPLITKKELERMMCVAYKNKYKSIVVNPINIEFARTFIDLRLKSTIGLVSVIGYPLGETPTEVKLCEIKKALGDGADELDVMLAVSRIKMNDWGYIKNEIYRIMKACKKHVVKVIVESSSLTKGELTKVCSLCAKYRVNYVQTSSGFLNGGATIEDVELIKTTCQGRCEAKASGGIENRTQALVMLRAGATRIGTSREI